MHARLCPVSIYAPIGLQLCVTAGSHAALLYSCVTSVRVSGFGGPGRVLIPTSCRGLRGRPLVIPRFENI